MYLIVPWAELTAVVEPFYPKISETGGRPPLPLERMLRVYFLQLWFNLSDPAVEEALYESSSMRNFAGIDLGVEAARDRRSCRCGLRDSGYPTHGGRRGRIQILRFAL
jgi:Transposase domain (DUF772)